MNEIRDSITYLIAEFQRYYPQWVQEGMEDSTESVIKTLNRIDANLTKNTRDTATGIKTLNTTMAAFAKTMGGAAMTNIKLMKDEQTYRKAILENLKKEAMSRKEQTVQLDKAIKSLKQFNTEVEELNELHEDLNKTIKMNTKTLDSLDTELEKLEDTVTDTAKKTKKATDSIVDLGKTAEDTSLDMQRVIKSMANYHFVVERFMNQVRGNLSDPNNVGRTISGMGDTIGVALEGVANRLDKASPMVSAGFTALSGTVRMLANTYGGLINASEDQIKTYRELNKAGIILSKRFDESAYMARDFGLNHDQMVKAMISNNSLFSKASSDTMQQFLKASHMATRANSIYARMGFTQEETMDFMAKYIENMKITGTYEAARSRGVVEGMINQGFTGIKQITEFFGKELMDVIKQTNEFMRKGETQAQMAMFRAQLSPEQQAAYDKKLSEAEMVIQQMPEQAQNAMRATIMQEFARSTGGIVPPEIAKLALGFQNVAPEISSALRSFTSDETMDQTNLVQALISGTKQDTARDTFGSRIGAASAIGLTSSPELKEASLALYGMSGALAGTDLETFMERIAISGAIQSGGGNELTEDEKKSQELLQNTVALSNQVVSLVATFNAGVLDIAKTQFGQESFKMIGENLESATTLLQSTMEGITTVLDTGVMGQIASNMDKLVMIAGAILAAIVTKGAMTGIGGALKGIKGTGGALTGAGGAKSLGSLGGQAAALSAGPFIAAALGMAGFTGVIQHNRLSGTELDAARAEAERQSQMMNDGMNVYGDPNIPYTPAPKVMPQTFDEFGIGSFASGGLIKGPTIGLLAEAGRPEMVMPLDPSMSDLAKHIAEKHVEIVGPFLRQLNRDLIYNIYRENVDPLDLIFTKSLDKFFFSKMEIQATADTLNSSSMRENATLGRTANTMRAMGINVNQLATASSGNSGGYTESGQLARAALEADPEWAAQISHMKTKYPNLSEDDLYRMMMGESNLNPTAINKDSNATGLFQFTPAVMRELGVTQEQVLKMTPADQLKLYEKYLDKWNYSGGPLGIMQAAPAYANKPGNFEVYSPGTKAYAQNPGWIGSDGRITVNSINDYYNRQPTPMSASDNVVMANQGAIRNMSISPELHQKLSDAVMKVFGPGYVAEVYSGGNDPNNPYGSNRHNNGMAADVRIRAPDGTYLTGNQNAALAQYWLAAQHGSAGAGMGAGGTGLHLDLLTQDKLASNQGLSWTYENATKSQRQALNNGRAGIMPELYVPNTMPTSVTTPSTNSQNAQTLEAVTTAANVIADKVVSALNTTSADTQRVIRDQQVAIARMNGIVAAPRGGR